MKRPWLSDISCLVLACWLSLNQRLDWYIIARASISRCIQQQWIQTPHPARGDWYGAGKTIEKHLEPISLRVHMIITDLHICPNHTFSIDRLFLKERLKGWSDWDDGIGREWYQWSVRSVIAGVKHDDSAVWATNSHYYYYYYYCRQLLQYQHLEFLLRIWSRLTIIHVWSV